jgi:hypothetical protein
VAWEQSRMTVLDGAEVPVSEYFLGHPADVLGTMGAVNGTYRADDLVVTPAGDTTEAFAQALDRIAAEARQRGLIWAPLSAARPTQPLQVPESRHPDGYLEACPDGTFTEVADGVARPFEVPRTQAAELRALLGLRDVAMHLLAAESATPEDTRETETLREQLGLRYDRYAATYGPLNRFSLRRTGRADPATGEPAMARVAPPQGVSAGIRSRHWFTRWRSSSPPGSARRRHPSSPTA